MFKIVFGLVRDVRTGTGTFELSNSPGWGREKTANAPSSINTATFFKLITQSSNGILSILVCGFLFQLTSAFSVWSGFVTAPRTSPCDDTSLCYGFSTVIKSLNSFTNIIGCSLNNVNRNFIQ